MSQSLLSQGYLFYIKCIFYKHNSKNVTIPFKSGLSFLLFEGGVEISEIAKVTIPFKSGLSFLFKNVPSFILRQNTSQSLLSQGYLFYRIKNQTPMDYC